MAMRLRVVSSQSRQLGERAGKVFGVHGGSIGRAADNDWILPDPERYISAHHARIEYRAGKFVLHDTSTNGMYVNDASEPLGKNAEHELADGDRLRFGDFEVLVSIDSSNDVPAEESAVAAHDGRGKTNPAAAKSTQNDLGEALDLDSLLASDHNGESGSPYGPVDAYGQPIKSPGRRTMRSKLRPSVKSLLDDKAELSMPGTGPGGPDRAKPWHMTTRPFAPAKAGAAAAQKSGATSSTAENVLSASGSRPRLEGTESSDVAGAIQALCRGAGIPASAIPTELHGRFLQTAGQLLRELVLGLTATRQARAELKGRLRIQAPEDDNGSLPLASGVDEALRKLLSGATARNVTQAEAVRGGFQAIGHHERALIEATQAALADFIQRLSPEELEERFARGTKRSSIMGSGNVKARYWELYSEFFRGLTQGSGESMPHVFVEAFARAYESSIRELDGASGQRERIASEGS
jgi:type VI secretion system protein